MATHNQNNKSIKEPKIRNFVAESEILTQSINLENKHLRINSEFACNPSKIKTIPSPPLIGRISKTEEEKTRKENDEINHEFNAYLQNKLTVFNETPNQKNKYPLTTSQEIGWFLEYVN